MIINYSAPSIKELYISSYPFPHIVLDNFLSDEGKLKSSVNELRGFQYWGYDDSLYSENNQINKMFCPWNRQSMDDLKTHTPITYEILQFFNSREVISFLEELTGIENLIADPFFVGGGVHKIMTGGKLSIHADYNLHPETNLHRRINLLVYLNENWEDEWGGHLELWNKSLTHCAEKIAPIFNRAVIFNITDDAFHGHPDPLKSPEGVDRLSFALYYFTEDRPENEKSEKHYALWKETSGGDINSIFEI